MMTAKPIAVAPIVVNNPRGVMGPPLPVGGIALVRSHRATARAMSDPSYGGFLNRSLLKVGARPVRFLGHRRDVTENIVVQPEERAGKSVRRQ
jgi:hypothetical protein